MSRLFLSAGALLLVAAIAAVAILVRDPDLPPSLDTPPLGIVPSRRFGVTAADPGTVPIERTGAGWYINYTDEPDARLQLEFMPVVFWQTDRQPVTRDSIAR